MRITAYPTTTSTAILGQAGAAEPAALATTMTGETPRQVAADIKPLKESPAVALRETASNFEFNGNEEVG